MNENIDKLAHETIKKDKCWSEWKKVWHNSDLITENEFTVLIV